MPSPSETPILLPLLGGIGIGTIISAAIGYRVAILNLRQASIGALRDDIATCLKELEVVYIAVENVRACENGENDGDLPTLVKQRQEARVAFLFIHNRIRLRLNLIDPLHKELDNKLYVFGTVETRVPNPEAVRDLVEMAGKLLRREEENARWWPLARTIRFVARLIGSRSRPGRTPVAEGKKLPETK